MAIVFFGYVWIWYAATPALRRSLPRRRVEEELQDTTYTHTHTVHTLAIAKQQQRPAITTSHPQVCLPLSFQRNGTQNKKKKKIAHVDALLLMWNGEENIRAILLLLQL